MVWQAASLLLAYPDEDLPRRLDLIEGAARDLPEDLRTDVLSCVAHLRGLTTMAAALQYAETFDWRRRRTLFLTHYTAGDTRNRGHALLDVAGVYRSAGATPPADELPDHLAVILEFAATIDPVTGARLLAQHRPSIGLRRDALVKEGSPYAPVVDAVLRTLPEPDAAVTLAAARLAAAGPPVERVGLEPFRFAPPAQQGAR